MNLAMQLSILVVVMILVILTIIVCRMCFQKAKRPTSRYIGNRSAASGEHMLNNTDVGRASLSVNTRALITPKCLLDKAPLSNAFDDKDIIRKKCLITKTNRLSEPTPTRVSSRFLAKPDDYGHTTVVVCKTTPDTNITVFDRALSPCTVQRINALFEEHEISHHESCKKTKPTFINIPTDSEFDLLRKIQTSCLNRKLSVTQRMSENSGLKLPFDSSAQCSEHLHGISTENTKESGYTIYGDTSVFQFIDANKNLTKDLIQKREGIKQ